MLCAATHTQLREAAAALMGERCLGGHCSAQARAGHETKGERAERAEQAEHAGRRAHGSWEVLDSRLGQAGQGVEGRAGAGGVGVTAAPRTSAQRPGPTRRSPA